MWQDACCFWAFYFYIQLKTQCTAVTRLRIYCVLIFGPFGIIHEFWGNNRWQKKRRAHSPGLNKCVIVTKSWISGSTCLFIIFYLIGGHVTGYKGVFWLNIFLKSCHTKDREMKLLTLSDSIKKPHLHLVITWWFVQGSDYYYTSLFVIEEII